MLDKTQFIGYNYSIENEKLMERLCQLYPKMRKRYS